MNKKDLISKALDVLNLNNIKKTVMAPKHTFHISDDSDNGCDFVVRTTKKKVPYTYEDLSVVIDSIMVAIVDAMKKGESVTVHGFGSLDSVYRKPRQAIHPATNEWCEVKGRYVAKFTPGSSIREAMKYYNMQVEEKEKDAFEWQQY